MLTVSCLECQQRIHLGPGPKIGQLVICKSCNAELEVIWLFPICLDNLEITDQILANQNQSIE
jgi:lysine biosynthesis protein LysW